MTINVLFVCLGNICRSPTAEGVFKKLVVEAGMQNRIQVDSAGTAGWHQGRAPDTRTIATAKSRGFDLSELRARQFIISDFNEYDYILAMDSQNLRDLTSLKPQHYSGYLGLFLHFGTQKTIAEVPDPYHGTSKDFELVVDLVEDAAAGLLKAIQQKAIK